MSDSRQAMRHLANKPIPPKPDPERARQLTLIAAKRAAASALRTMAARRAAGDLSVPTDLHDLLSEEALDRLGEAREAAEAAGLPDEMIDDTLEAARDS